MKGTLKHRLGSQLPMRINPKNFFNRKLDFLPPHFTTTSKYFNEYEETKLNEWIYENCFGRYCIVKTVKWDSDSWKGMTTIGFEEPSDLTLLALSGRLNTQKSPF